MEMYKAPRINKKENPKANPMKQSEYYYYQSMGKALVGLERALELRRGRIEYVTVADILDNCDINPEEFESVFESPKQLLFDIYDEINILLSDPGTLLPNADTNQQLTDVFKRLKKKCPMLRVLRLVNDHYVWRENLKTLAPRIATDWPPVGSPEWDYLYANFCCQFALVLEKWETADFSDDRIKDCVRLIDMWIATGSMIYNSAEGLLADWSTNKR